MAGGEPNTNQKGSYMKSVIALLLSILIILVSVDLSSKVCYVTLTDRNGQQTILTGVGRNEL